MVIWVSQTLWTSSRVLFLTATEPVFEEEDFSILDQNNNASGGMLEVLEEETTCLLLKAEAYGNLANRGPGEEENNGENQSGALVLGGECNEALASKSTSDGSDSWHLHLSTESDNSGGSSNTSRDNQPQGLEMKTVLPNDQALGSEPLDRPTEAAALDMGGSLRVQEKPSDVAKTLLTGSCQVRVHTMIGSLQTGVGDHCGATIQVDAQP